MAAAGKRIGTHVAQYVQSKTHLCGTWACTKDMQEVLCAKIQGAYAFPP